jgi:hypothetical protein
MANANSTAAPAAPYRSNQSTHDDVGVTLSLEEAEMFARHAMKLISATFQNPAEHEHLLSGAQVLLQKSCAIMGRRIEEDLASRRGLSVAKAHVSAVEQATRYTLDCSVLFESIVVLAQHYQDEPADVEPFTEAIIAMAEKGRQRLSAADHELALISKHSPVREDAALAAGGAA